LSELQGALDAIDLKIIKYSPDKQRPVSTDRNGTLSIKKFMELLSNELRERVSEFPRVLKGIYDEREMGKLIHELAQDQGLVKEKFEAPAELDGLVLNCNMSAKGRDDQFFLTYPDETISPISGHFYLLAHQMGPIEATAVARRVIPEYMPREKAGVMQRKTGEGKEYPAFNTYTPAPWTKVKLDEVPNKPPNLFAKLVDHLFPIPIEREYFYDWLHASLFDRAFVYLVLRGDPGTGKNRLKLVLRALHGHVNSIDGKRSTLVERFNSQLSDSTLGWFDELKYDMDMENVMKELQNDSISIERKGVDATRATKIYASLVISNNKPRDNYIAFDARKFVPLWITDQRLEVSMDPMYIDRLTKRVEDENSPTYDPVYIAKIAAWLKKRGKTGNWPNLEYRGPAFYLLAHTSLSRWQKKAAMLVMETDPTKNMKVEYDEKDGFLWSTLEEMSLKKNGDKSLQFPDFTTVSHFLNIFRDLDGQKVFKIKPVKGSLMNDFYVKPLTEKVNIATESSAMGMRKGESRDKTKSKAAKEDSETYDL